MTTPRSRPWDFGAPVHGYHWAADDPVGRVLLQHGYSEHAERFVARHSRLIPRLLKRRIAVYAFDLPGHGRSPGRRGSCDVLDATRHHLAAKRVLAADGPILLYGHSLGGLVTAHTVAEDADGVAAVILSSPALPGPGSWGLRALAASLATVAPHATAPLPAAPISSLARAAENASLIASDPLMYRGRLTNLTARTALATGGDVWRGAPSWRVPTLIMHGDADRSTDPRASVRLHQAIRSRDKTLRIVDGGQHELLNDEEREETLGFLLEWISARVRQEGRR